MDSILIEGYSINYLKEELLRTGQLVPLINENDKEPSWDGMINVYKDSKISNSNILGRVPIQVKGKKESIKNFKKKEISYPIEITDLKNYLNDGGAIFFVVYIDKENPQNRKIYYVVLTVVRLKTELGRAIGKKTKSVKFKEFPVEDKEKIRVIRGGLEHMKKQKSFSNIPLLTLDNLNIKEIKEMVIPVFPIKEESPVESLLNSDIYLYAKTKNNSIPQPIKALFTRLEIREKQKAKISIDDRQYYSLIEIIRKKDDTRFLLGESITMIIEGKEIGSLNYKNTDNIRVLANDLEFTIQLIEKGYFYFNDIKVNIDNKTLDFSNFNKEYQKKELKILKDIVKLLDILNCKEDLKLSEITKEGWIQLNYLIKGLVYNELVEGLKGSNFSLKFFNIGKLKFLISIKAEENGKFRLLDFFREEFSTELVFKKGKKFPISQYIILKKEDLYLVNNIRYDIILSSFKEIKRYPETINSINQFLLNLILAYDESKKEELLLIAKKFSEWICSEFNEKELNYSIKKLNQLQIIKRLRNLTEDEEEEIYEILEEKNIDDGIRTGCYILLKQKIPAKRYFEKIDENYKKGFIISPIYNLFKEL